MRVGVLLDTNAGPVGRPPPSRHEIQSFHAWFLECARMLDQEPAIDAVFVAERHVRPDCLAPAPLELLAALAGVTRRVRLGTYVLMPPLYPPVGLFERLAVIDHLSGGRLILGVGAGFHPAYFASHGQLFDHRGKNLDRWLEAADHDWPRGQIELAGSAHYLLPPCQHPRPPLWVGGTSEQAARRAARWGDAFAVAFSDRNLAHLIQTYRDTCQSEHRSSQLVYLQAAWVRPRAAAEEIRDYLGTVYESELSLYRAHGQVQAEGPVTLKRMLPRMYVGDSPSVVEHASKDAERWGIDYLVLRVHIAGPPPDAVLDCLGRIASEVAPALADGRVRRGRM